MSSLRSDESDSSLTTRVGVFSDNNINATGGFKDDGSGGSNGSFTTVDSKTVTVSGGIITNIV